MGLSLKRGQKMQVRKSVDKLSATQLDWWTHFSFLTSQVYSRIFRLFPSNSKFFRKIRGFIPFNFHKQNRRKGQGFCASAVSRVFGK